MCGAADWLHRNDGPDSWCHFQRAIIDNSYTHTHTHTMRLFDTYPVSLSTPWSHLSQTVPFRAIYLKAFFLHSVSVYVCMYVVICVC